MRGHPSERPPERDEPGPHPEAGPIQKSATTTDKPNPITTPLRQCHADTVPVQLRRRRKESYRCEPLGESGNIRDPWVPWRPEKLTEKDIDGAVAAAAHLLADGYVPVFDLPTLRAMWKAGHHQLVDDLRGGGR
jgi:hypothetical protein